MQSCYHLSPDELDHRSDRDADAKLVFVEVSDQLVFELTGYLPGELSSRDASVVRGRAQALWDRFLRVAQS